MSYDDPLDKIFDLVVLGTGTTASIIAAAASKHGYSVVHIDRQEFYGHTETTLSLPQFHQLVLSQYYAQSSTNQGTKEISSTVVSASSDQHRPTVNLPSSIDVTSTISIDNHEDALDSHPTATTTNSFDDAASPSSSVSFQRLPWLYVYDPPDASSTPSPSSSSTPKYTVPPYLTSVSRRMAIDMHPRLTLSKGKFTSLLVNSNVSSYLEYKPLDCAYLAIPSSSPSSTLSVIRVPANKSDIFANEQLTLLEKRKLMKFLQFAQDERIKFEEEEEIKRSQEQTKYLSANSMDNAVLSSAVVTLNERELGQGRSLLRPQNKSTTEETNDTYRTTNKSIAELFYSTGITDALFPMLAYAVALLENVTEYKGDSNATTTTVSSLSAKEGMLRINQYLGAIGRYGRTAFITNMYGSGEIPQAFCRLCAVKGGIYMLRTNVQQYLKGYHRIPPSTTPTENSSTPTVDKEAPNNPAPEISTDSSSSSSLPSIVAIQTDSSDARYIRCRRILTEYSYLPSVWQTMMNPSREKFVTIVGTVITQSSLHLPGFLSSQVATGSTDIGVSNKELVHIIIPPFTVPSTGSFPHAINLYQQGPSNAACPYGWYICQLYTRIKVTVPNDTKDNVVPTYPTVMEGVNAVRELIKVLHPSSSTSSASSAVPYTTIYGMVEDVVPADRTLASSNLYPDFPSNVTVIPNAYSNDHPSNLIHMEDAAVLAETVFRSLYPSKMIMFLPTEETTNDEEETYTENSAKEEDKVTAVVASNGTDSSGAGETATIDVPVSVTDASGVSASTAVATTTITAPPVLDVHAALALLDEVGDNVFDL